LIDPTLPPHWQTQIKAYRESRLTLQAWCDQEGVAKEQMKYWMYKRKKGQTSRSSSVSPIGFVPVHVEAPVRPAADSLWIQVGEIRIGVAAGFDPRLLRDVVEALHPHD
jgi:hypothetical protein